MRLRKLKNSGECMGNLGRILLKGVFQNSWIKIEYRNKEEEITYYMIGINDINPFNRKINCDSFNIAYSKDVDQRNIFFDSILSATVCEQTYHQTPQPLLTKLQEDREEFLFLNPINNREDLLDYYISCFKLDTIPYISKYGMIPGIDMDCLLENEEFQLTEEQFKILANNAFFQEEKKKNKAEKGNEKFENTLACNVLSINTKKGLFVLAYRNLDLDISKRVLRASKSLIFNKEFSYDSNTKDIKNVESIYKYIPEEEYYLLEETKVDLSRLVAVIHEYNNTRTSTYKSEVKTDERPFIVNLGKKYTVDIVKEVNGIKAMIQHPEEMSLPIKTFFGDPDSKLARRMNYPIFTVDNKFNIDQINAIHIGMKSPVSYIQGPPGTGKTQTLLNAIITAEFNGKTVLVTSNNNIPMDGVYEDILKLKYKNEIPLLFPAIRLGSFDNCTLAIERILEMYQCAKDLKTFDSRIKQLKEDRKKDMNLLVQMLSDYDYLTELKTKEQGLLSILEKNSNDMLSIDIQTQLDDIRKKILDLGDVEIEKFEDLMHQDDKYFYNFFMAIHFETASKLQSLDKQKYKDLMNVLKMSNKTKEEIADRTKAFRSYLSENENLGKFLDIFPIIISTNLSCTFLGDPSPHFDMVMMDEAGQCNVANALIPIVRCKQLMLVGDPQQLKPVIVLDKSINKELRKKYHIAKEYDYIENSIYTVFTNIDIINNETLLSYHYRCHEKIIGFSNQKYYHGKLKLKAPSGEKRPLVFVDTSKIDSKALSNIRNISEVEVEYICRFIKENKELNIGVITPFVHQKECIEYALEQRGIKNVTIGTVHAFQGDQKDVIIFSTAITNNTYPSTYEWLKNNRELINVAVSRAKNKLIMLGNKEALKNLSKESDDLKELAEYVSTNGESIVTDVSISSVALGTRQISTESEKELASTITQILSVINKQCYIKSEVPVSSIFNEDKMDSSIFFKQKFDLVIFEKQYSKDVILLAVELNGPEHYSDEEVIRRDKKKKEFCDSHRLKLLNIPRDCARDYYDIKESLLSFVTVKK